MKRSMILLSALLLLRCGESYHPANTNDNENKNPYCGDGVLDPGEQCDDGSRNSDVEPDACRTDCTNPRCNDYVADSDEECDRSDLNGQDCWDVGDFNRGTLGCTNDCVFDTSLCGSCGNETAEGEEGDPQYETCDGSDLRGEDCISIGQAQGALRCNQDCEWDISGCTGGGTTCGDGNVEAGEQCDDGNTQACDGCSPTCIVEECGNGVMECGEQCDDANVVNEDHCLTDCTLNTCGDGFVNLGVETCDDGNGGNTDACPDGPTGTCLNAACGDGFVQVGVEVCDDGNEGNTDSCPDGVGGTCEPASCGDGHVQSGVETCDPGSDSSCHNNCSNYCGDGIMGHPLYENCDDNISCSPDCQRFCGDGVIDTDLGEVCDDRAIEIPYDGGPLDGNLTGGVSFTCLADCTTSSCGDGICNIAADPNGAHEDERDFCAQDCVCSTWNRDQCGTECCPVGDTCCGASGCTTQWSMIPGTQNCGTCGNNCAANEVCQNIGLGPYCSTL